MLFLCLGLFGAWVVLSFPPPNGLARQVSHRLPENPLHSSTRTCLSAEG